MQISHNLDKQELVKALWDVVEDEDIGDMFLGDITEKLEQTETNVENCLDTLDNISRDIEETNAEVIYICQGLLPGIKTGLFLLFALNLSMFVVVLVFTFRMAF